jgi:uncharacterized protein YdeI (YjbR/CyaY-like superfamily)
MKISGGTVHSLPTDLKKMLVSYGDLQSLWENITPLARNEFICWIVSAKKPETRARRIAIAKDKLSRGERRPCCWIGCIHRIDKAISPSVQAIVNRR